MEDQFLEDESESRRVEVPSDPGPDPERACAQAELSYQFAQTLESLPASYRAIIRLCDFEGFSGKEAAKRLGLSVSALKAQHHRARVAIRESMGARVAGKGISQRRRSTPGRNGCESKLKSADCIYQL